MKFNSLKYIATIFLAISISIVAKAQQQTDDVLLRAMKTEIDRSRAEYKRDSLARPFFISLLVNESNLNYTYSTAFGQENEEELNTRKKISAEPLVLVGDYHRTQNFNGNGDATITLPVENDEKAIRSAIWISLDQLYKNAARNYVDKMAWLKQENLKEEELALDDYEKRKPTVLVQEIEKQNYDFTPVKQLSLRIGKLLTEKVKKENLLIEDLSTWFSFNYKILRYYDTEGSMFRYPRQDGVLNISLSGVTPKGVSVSAYRAFKMNKLDKLPAFEQLEKAANEVVAEYKIKYTTEDQDDPYMGPLLIVDGQVESVVQQIVNNLYTSPKNRYSNGNHYQNMSGVRIVSKQLSVLINYGKNAQAMDGVKRDLSPIDIQAVIPPDSILLIKEGILKNMLTSRQPVKKFLTSNGNPKKGYKVEGVITLSGTQRYSYDEIKKMLIDEARLQGLEYAYIMNTNGKLHRKVNVETGEEIPFSADFNFDQIMKAMRRVLGVENTMDASTDGTIRYPKSILLEDAELTVRKSNERLKKDFVPRPKL